MDSNFEKVDAHQINKIVFPDWTLPGSTGGDIQQIVAVHLVVSCLCFRCLAAPVPRHCGSNRSQGTSFTSVVALTHASSFCETGFRAGQRLPAEML